MQLQELIDNPELPSLPEAIVRLNDAVAQNKSLKIINSIISHEPGLSARTLELANSAWYRRQQSVDTVREAIVIIGIDSLQQLLLASSVTRIFFGVPEKLMDMNTFWNDAIRFACYAKSVAEQCGEAAVSAQLFTAGLLTPIGKLILLLYAPDQAAALLQGKGGFEEEQQTLGFSCNQISAALLKKWRTSEALHAPIGCYHAPQHCSAHQTSAHILKLAALLSLNDSNGEGKPEDSPSYKTLKLSADSLNLIHQTAKEAIHNAKSLVGL